MSLKTYIPLWLRLPRSTLWLIVAAVLVAAVAVIAPQKLEVTVYKASLLALAAVLGYWLDRAFFPYARPDSYLQRDWRLGTDAPQGEADYPVCPAYRYEFCVAQIRRAFVVGCAVLGMAMGL